MEVAATSHFRIHSAVKVFQGCQRPLYGRSNFKASIEQLVNSRCGRGSKRNRFGYPGSFSTHMPTHLQSSFVISISTLPVSYRPRCSNSNLVTVKGKIYTTKRTKNRYLRERGSRSVIMWYLQIHSPVVVEVETSSSW